METTSRNIATGPFINLRKITKDLLLPSHDYMTVREACFKLFSFFRDETAFDVHEIINQEHIRTSSGLAVSPYAAAFCILDIMRTKKFLQGIKEAIDTKLKENPGSAVKVLYAGTGPFGTLLLPLTTIYEPSQLQLVLMDINPISIEHLQKVIQHLNIGSYITDVVQADALSYIIPQKDQPDILVSETMKPGLQKEPQVSIVANLLAQCNPGTILIPELVKVDACLAGNLTRDPGAIIFLQTLFAFNDQAAKQVKENPEKIPLLNEGIVIEIKQAKENYTRLILSTSIKIFNDWRLDFNESGLTVRHGLMNMADISEFPARLLFRYKLKDEPGFIVTQLP